MMTYWSDFIGKLERLYVLPTTQAGMEQLARKGLALAGALLLLLAGWLIARRLSAAAVRVLKRKRVELTLTLFLGGVVKVAVWLLAVYLAAALLSIPVSPLVAAVGGGAFGLTLALQGTISNYGAGVVLVLARPFRVGDTISVAGCSGVVRAIRISVTELITAEGELTSIPNKKIIGEVVVNSFPNKLVTGALTIPNTYDPEQVIRSVSAAITGTDGVLAAPALTVGVDQFLPAAMVVSYRCWVPAERYVELRYAANLAVYHAVKDLRAAQPFLTP
ncbi:MAG: mechanosensitive ion channel family protein [Verrucomicrobiales bacterium]|jgi:small conductance mechanosensitive channel|nr:mechanosensitive ion channel family protein [Verrucomicrobiales bacterium]